MSLLDRTDPAAFTPWQIAGHVPLPKTVKGRVYLAERIQPTKQPVGHHVSLSTRILRVLSEGPATASEIREELSANLSTVRAHVKRLIDAESVVILHVRQPLGSGVPSIVYGLAEHAA